ncbi:unnamed protein product, partial [Timema podura]|nr:unnamed protein product [Timema podura]
QLESQPVDVEYVRLLHDLYSSDIINFSYRGYTLIGSHDTYRDIKLKRKYCNIKNIQPRDYDVPPSVCPSLATLKQYNGAIPSTYIMMLDLFQCFKLKVKGLYQPRYLLFGHFDGVKRPLWFIFSGMGSQWLEMGSKITEIPIIFESIQKSHNILKGKGIDLLHIITTTDKNIFNNILHSMVGITAIQPKLCSSITLVAPMTAHRSTIASREHTMPETEMADSRKKGTRGGSKSTHNPKDQPPPNRNYNSASNYRSPPHTISSLYPKLNHHLFPAPRIAIFKENKSHPNPNTSSKPIDLLVVLSMENNKDFVMSRDKP